MLKKQSFGKIEYFVHESGGAGRLLLTSGIHGDEGGIVEPLIEYVESNLSTLPSLIFIPRMSPSALVLGTRENDLGNNLNRMFGVEGEDEERYAIAKIAKDNSPYDLVATFHEDVIDPFTYFYETGDHSSRLELDKWRNKVKESGISLLNGSDDPDDPALGYQFEDGFNNEPKSKAYLSGAFEHWVVVENFAPRCLNFEIPTIATIDQKKKLVEAAFSHLIIPIFRNKV